MIRTAQNAALFLIFLTPLAYEISLPGLGFSHRGLQVSPFDWVILPLFGLSLLYIARTRRVSFNFIKPYVLGLGAIYFASSLSLYLSVSSSAFVVSNLYLVKFLAFFTAGFWLCDHPDQLKLEKDLNRCHLYLILSLSIIILVGLVEAWYLNHTGIYRYWTAFPRISSTFGTFEEIGSGVETNALAAYLMLPLFYLIYYAVYIRRPWWWWILLPGLCICILFTFSRSVFLALAIGSVFFLKFNKTRWIPITGAFGIVILLFSVQHFMDTQLTEYLSIAYFSLIEPIVAQLQGEGASDISAGIRLNIMLHTDEFILDESWKNGTILGNGFSSFRFYADEKLMSIGLGHRTRSLYNFISEAIFDAGFLGLIIWLIILISLYRLYNTAFSTFSQKASENSTPFSTKNLLHLSCLAATLRHTLLCLCIVAMTYSPFILWRVVTGFLVLSCFLKAALLVVRNSESTELKSKL